MLSELEDTTAKWGLGLFIFDAILLILFFFTESVRGIIRKDLILNLFLLAGSLVIFSFIIFLASINGLEHRIHVFANTPVSSVYLNILVATTWLFLIALPIGVLLLKLSGIADGNNFYDFGAYYNAAERVIYRYPLYDSTTLYDKVTDLPSSPDRYLYAPIVSLLFVPFAYLQFQTAALVWSAVSITVYLIGITILVYSLNVELSLYSWIAVCLGVLAFGPFVITFIAGQVTGIVTGCLCLSAAMFQMQNKQRVSAASSLLTIPVAFKLYYAPAGAPLLRDNHRLFISLLTGIIIALAGIFAFGIGTTIDYLNILADGKGWGAASDPPTEWNINDFHPLYYLGDLGHVLRAAFLGTIAVISYQSRRHDFEYIDLYMYSFGLLGIVIGVPVFVTSGLTVTVPVILFLLVTTYRERPMVFLTVLASALLLHIHPYTNEFLVRIFTLYIESPRWATLIIPAVQPAAWGIFLLIICTVYEYTRCCARSEPVH